MRLSNAQTAVIQAVYNVNRNVVVVVNGGSCVEMPWLDKVKAVVHTYLLGEGGGTAIANILSGKVSPSGKLAETFPYSYKDTPARDYYAPDRENNMLYKESILVGYRYYDKAKVPVMFPFGHGLSYTKFNYTNLMVSSQRLSSNDTLIVYVDVENAGEFNGEEVVQLYVSKGDTKVFRADKELKAFERVELNAGEKKRVKLTLDRSAFEYYSTVLRKWCVEPGKYSIFVGSSSADLRIAIDVDITSDDDFSLERDYYNLSPSYFAGNVKQATDREFEYLLNFTIDSIEPADNGGRLTSDNTLSDAIFTPAGAKIETVVRNSLSNLLEGDEIAQKLAYESIMNVPLKRMSATTKGAISEDMINGFVLLLNSRDAKHSTEMIARGIAGTVKNILPMMLENLK